MKEGGREGRREGGTEGSCWWGAFNFVQCIEQLHVG